jgi:hypothetical protein
MGFHRRIINKEVTKDYLDSNKLETLYSSESLIFMDEFSSEVFEFFKNGKKTEEILLIINEENKQ